MNLIKDDMAQIQYHIVSTLRPALFSLSNGRLAIAGGTIDSVNGMPVTSTYVEVPDGTKLSDISHSFPTSTVEQTPQFKRVWQVAGSARGVTYDVTQYGQKFVCTCHGYTYRKKCRHIESAIAQSMAK